MAEAKFKETYFCFGKCDGCFKKRALRPAFSTFDKGVIVEGAAEPIRRDKHVCRRCWTDGGWIKRSYGDSQA